MRTSERGVAFIAASANGTRSVVTWVPGRPAVEVVRYPLPRLTDADCPVPEPIEVGTPDGGVDGRPVGNGVGWYDGNGVGV